jgi:hypothetical protein
MASGYRAIRADNREQTTCFCGVLGHAETRETAMFDHNYPAAVAGSLQRREKKKTGGSRSATGPVTGLDVTLDHLL